MFSPAVDSTHTPVAKKNLPAGCVEDCPGCSHRTWDAETSENQKWNWIKTKLPDFENKISSVCGPLGSFRWGYRQKTILHSQWNGKSWNFGMLRSKRCEGQWTYEVVPIHHCPIHSSLIRKAVQILSKELPDSSQMPLAYLCISGTLATLVLKSSQLPSLPDLDWAQMGLTGVFVNLNPSAGNRVFSSRGWKKIWGEELGVDHEMVYGPDSFQQLLPGLHDLALQQVKAFLNPTPGSGVLDLYSGIGRSLRLWKELGVPFLGVELNGDAYRCAEMNIGIGSILRGRVSERLCHLKRWSDEVGLKELLIYANPPRIGLETEVASWIAEEARPARIAYLSCSVGTLARDLSILTRNEYSVTRIIPYDFFPQTHHVETLTLLARV